MAEEKKYLTVDEKLAQLNINDYDMPRDKAQIMGWRDRLLQLNVMKDFVHHPGSVVLIRAGREEIIRINALLNDRDLLLNPNRLGERASLLAERDTHLFYLHIFDVNPEQEIEMIEKAVDLELKPV